MKVGNDLACHQVSSHSGDAGHVSALFFFQRKSWHWMDQRWNSEEGQRVAGGGPWTQKSLTSKVYSGLSPSSRAGFPVTFLVTPQRTGAVGNLLLLPY